MYGGQISRAKNGPQTRGGNNCGRDCTSNSFYGRQLTSTRRSPILSTIEIRASTRITLLLGKDLTGNVSPDL